MESEDDNEALLTLFFGVVEDIPIWELSVDLKGALLVVAIASAFVGSLMFGLDFGLDFSIVSSWIGLESSN